MCTFAGLLRPMRQSCIPTELHPHSALTNPELIGLNLNNHTKYSAKSPNGYLEPQCSVKNPTMTSGGQLSVRPLANATPPLIDELKLRALQLSPLYPSSKSTLYSNQAQSFSVFSGNKSCPLPYPQPSSSQTSLPQAS